MTATQLHAGRYVHDEDQRRRGEEETDARDRRGRGGTEGHGPQGREASQGSDLSISGDEVGGASFEVSPRSFIDLEAFANVGEQPLPSDAARVSKEEADAARAVGELKVSADKIIAFLLNENRSLSQQLVASQQHNQRLSVEREEAARALGSMSDKFGRSLRALEETLACLNNAFDFVDLERIGEYKETCGIVEHKSVQVDMLTEARGSASSRKEAVVLSPRYQDVDMILDKTRSFLEDFDKRTSELRSASSSPAKKVKKVKHQHAGEDWLERSFGSEGFMRESDIYPSFDSADHQSLPKRYTTNEMLIFRRFLKAKKDLMLHGWE
ncbi:hypothetical protein GUITHDRAFT_116638 [Guillardia theta CCMP2712]|uniref:Uncharacterized protein n=2 Tax=Guillardia theta TaxID=55529 RepID=L1ILT8_GUITC|nr:hypothetical protein GUITHDRAFT_116638 [Guillardia theta CCMP2712]EKX37221.1 hypothetical protein GUITHDRAFT_116638 [Guillardia theta CCMP2712]|eukprot:XP_005824201.1 hypothetical protein GUITHDRAFT_116638 [Guillardia theta CCMP2712]